MGLLDVHADAIRSSFDFDQRNPQPDAAAPSFSAWSFATSGIKGLAKSGFYSTLANFADLQAGMDAGRLNSVAAHEGTPEEKAALDKQFRQELLTHRAWGTSMRQSAAEALPDPLTAHKADQVVASVGSGLGRAVAAVGTMGPVAGGAVFGLGQADSEYQDLRSRGVDHETALKVAGVTGVVSGLTAGAPAGGSTILRTVGIAAAAGPVSYVAQEGLSKQILQKAGYSDEAAMHDPTDPLGLALSVALPGVMGAFHVRGLAKTARLEAAKVAIESGGQRYGADGQLLTSPKGALGEHQVMPATARDPGFGIKPAALGPDGKPNPDELARVGTELFASHYQHFGGDSAKTLAAYNAGRGAVEAAVAKHGEDWLAHMPEETQNYVAKGLKVHTDASVAHAGNDPDTVDAARVQVLNRTLSEALPDHPHAVRAFTDAADVVAAGHFDAAPPDPLAGTRLVDEAGQPLRVFHGTGDDFAHFGEDANVQAMRNILKGTAFEGQMDGRFFFVDDPRAASEYALGAKVNGEGANVRPAHLNLRNPLEVDAKGARGPDKFALVEDSIGRAIDGGHDGVVLRNVFDHISDDPSTQTTPHTVAIAFRRDQIHSTFRELPRPTPRTEARSPLPAADGLATEPVKTATAGAAHEVFQAPEPSAPGAAAAGGREAPAGGGTSPAAQPPSPDVIRADAAIAERPDLRVQLPGSTETVSAAEAMKRIQSEAANDAAGDTRLLRAAVQCALSFL